MNLIFNMENFTVIIKLFLAAILGGAIGFEREVHNRPAGFRTHILVTIGSSLLMILSMNMGPNSDPSRIAAQVVSGIGFLGAGTILRTGNNIEGLTTAASLWVCSAIGLSVGSGFYLGGIFVTIIVLFFLEKVSSFERFINKKNYKTFRILGNTRPGFIGDIGTLLGKYNIVIKSISINAIEEGEDGEKINIGNLDEEVVFTVKLPSNIEIEKVIQSIYNISGVGQVLLD